MKQQKRLRDRTEKGKLDCTNKRVQACQPILHRLTLTVSHKAGHKCFVIPPSSKIELNA